MGSVLSRVPSFHRQHSNVYSKKHITAAPFSPATHTAAEFRKRRTEKRWRRGALVRTGDLYWYWVPVPVMNIDHSLCIGITEVWLVRWTVVELVQQRQQKEKEVLSACTQQQAVVQPERQRLFTVPWSRRWDRWSYLERCRWTGTTPPWWRPLRVPRSARYRWCTHCSSEREQDTSGTDRSSDSNGQITGLTNNVSCKSCAAFIDSESRYPHTLNKGSNFNRGSAGVSGMTFTSLTYDFITKHFDFIR